MFSYDLLNQAAAVFIRFITFEGSCFGEIFVKGICFFAANVDLSEEREGNAVVQAAEIFDMFIIFRIRSKN